MKAWHVCDGDEGSLLVFAASRGRARFMAFTHGTWEYENYIDLRCRRAPQWDGLFDSEKVIDENADLPPGAEPFYSDPEYVI